ncbi:hypothetical protein BsWGS_17997 [Bradybaena similaris]
MSEYWKSVPRKFCDFCKCWITDNKPSVEFHERGKRHKENVELKLTEIRKKSLETSLHANQVKSDMEKLEMAALEAFKKDLKDNPELAAQYGVSLEPKPPSADRDGKSSKLPATDHDGNSSKLPATDLPDTEAKCEKVKEWYEAVSAEGYHYYWNTNTGESTWEAPEEYVSMQEQEAEQAKDNSALAGAAKEVSSVADVLVTSKDVKPAVTTRLDPSNSRSAYGGWAVVKEIEQPVIYNETSVPPPLTDIPLPELEDVQENSLKPQKHKFKEKTVTSINSTSGGVVTFKKRKIAPGVRNIRQKDNNS